jgi:uncharacterized protein (TIGR02118 family)
VANAYGKQKVKRSDGYRFSTGRCSAVDGAAYGRFHGRRQSPNEVIVIAAISVMQRRPDISVAQFRKHWLDPHGVLTAGLPGVRHYIQSHVVGSPHDNALAREFDLMGFPELWFDSYDQRRIAYSSPRIAECNIDSEQFVGAVKRIVAEPKVVKAAPKGSVKVFILNIGEQVDAAWIDAYQERALKLPGVAGYVRQTILDQAKAPDSKIPELVLPIAGIAEVSFENEHALARAVGALVPADEADHLALYVVEDYILV